jgi:ferredoxin
VKTLFEAFLQQHDSRAWAAVRTSLIPSVHEVDRAAASIWFHFFPLPLADAFARSEHPAQLAQDLRLEGNWRLAEQHDTSHWFLYGHRYWPRVKAAIISRAESNAPASTLELGTIVRDVAREVASAERAEESLTLGIAAVGLMTLQQIGLAAFREDTKQVTHGDTKAEDVARDFTAESPARLLARRRKNDSQGLMGMFRGLKARYTVTFDERRDTARFPLIFQQHLTTASANDTRAYESGPRRCHEGPIPVQCRTASCGTCWVGVLGGAERLSDVDEMEARRMKEFGYINTTEATPVIRLACMALGSGNVSIVIPPWNGFVGKAGLGT